MAGGKSELTGGTQLVLLACLVMLAGCGQAHGPGAPQPATGTGGSSASAMPWQPYDPHWSNAKYTDGLRKHGVRVSGPDSFGDLGFVGKPLNRAVFLTAQRACGVVSWVSGRVPVRVVVR